MESASEETENSDFERIEKVDVADYNEKDALLMNGSLGHPHPSEPTKLSFEKCKWSNASLNFDLRNF